MTVVTPDLDVDANNDGTINVNNQSEDDQKENPTNPTAQRKVIQLLDDAGDATPSRLAAKWNSFAELRVSNTAPQGVADVTYQIVFAANVCVYRKKDGPCSAVSTGDTVDFTYEYRMEGTTAASHAVTLKAFKGATELEAAADVVQVGVVRVDIQEPTVSEATEESPGAYIVLNDDDDNENGQVDHTEAMTDERLLEEVDDVRDLELILEPSEAWNWGTAQLLFGPGYINVYVYDAEQPQGQRWSKPANPIALEDGYRDYYYEGKAAVDGAWIILEMTPSGAASPTLEDRIRVTVFVVEVFKIAGELVADFDGRARSTSSANNPTVEVQAKLTPPIADFPVYWTLTDPDDPSSNTHPVDWNDDDGVDTDGDGADVDVNDNRGTGSLDTPSSRTGENGIAIVTLTATPYGGDNFVVEVRHDPTETRPRDKTPLITVWMRRTVEVDEMTGADAKEGFLNTAGAQAFYEFDIDVSELPATHTRTFVEPDILDNDEDMDVDSVLDPNEDDGAILPTNANATNRSQPDDDGDGALEDFSALAPGDRFLQNMAYWEATGQAFANTTDSGARDVHVIGALDFHPYTTGGYGFGFTASGYTPPSSNDSFVFDNRDWNGTAAHEVFSHVFGCTHAGPPAYAAHRRTALHSVADCLANGSSLAHQNMQLCPHCVDFLRNLGL